MTNNGFVYRDFTVAADGFAGHLVQPVDASQAVIVVSGGEKGVIGGIKLAERFADYGIAALSLSLFGAPGLGPGPDRIPIDMFEPAIRLLKEMYSSVSLYGISMGSICVSLAAIYIGQIDKLILVSPGHVPFEGTLDKKHMTGHSFVTWKGEDIPYIKENFSAYRAMRYSFDSRAGRKVLGMWRTFMDAYEKDEGVLPLEKCGADILMLASTSDEAWPSDYSAHLLEKRLERHNYSKPYKVVLYPHASHLLGIMPSETREKWLYRMIPAIGLVYRQFHTNKQECMDALHASEKEAIDWLKGKELK